MGSPRVLGGGAVGREGPRGPEELVEGHERPAGHPSGEHVLCPPPIALVEGGAGPAPDQAGVRGKNLSDHGRGQQAEANDIEPADVREGQPDRAVVLVAGPQRPPARDSNDAPPSGQPVRPAGSETGST